MRTNRGQLWQIQPTLNRLGAGAAGAGSSDACAGTRVCIPSSSRTSSLRQSLSRGWPEAQCSCGGRHLYTEGTATRMTHIVRGRTETPVGLPPIVHGPCLDLGDYTQGLRLSGSSAIATTKCSPNWGGRKYTHRTVAIGSPLV